MHGLLQVVQVLIHTQMLVCWYIRSMGAMDASQTFMTLAHRAESIELQLPSFGEVSRAMIMVVWYCLAIQMVESYTVLTWIVWLRAPMQGMEVRWLETVLLRE